MNQVITITVACLFEVCSPKCETQTQEMSSSKQRIKEFEWKIMENCRTVSVELVNQVLCDEKNGKCRLSTLCLLNADHGEMVHDGRVKSMWQHARYNGIIVIGQD